MPANIRKMLMAVAMISAAPPAFADVITDWDEKAVAIVTPCCRTIVSASWGWSMPRCSTQ